MTSHPNRIPGDEVTDYRTWKIPEINGGNVLPSAEREARQRREKAARARGEVVGESVESNEFGGPITASELGKITEEAHREGYAAGFEQGHAEGVKTGSAEGENAAYAATRDKLDTNLASLTQLIDGLTDPFDEQTQALQTLMLQTIMSLAASVVKREISLQPLEMQTLVESAVDALPKISGKVTIELHPDDIAMLRECHPHKAARWQLQENAELQRGGVKVYGKDSLVDFSIERQLAILEEKLLRGELVAAEQQESDEKEDSEGKAE